MQTEIPFQHLQNNLAEYCRGNAEAPEAYASLPQNLPQYRSLVFNVILGTLEQAFPYTLSAIGDEVFGELVDEFFSKHAARNPEIWKLPAEFVEYISESGTALHLNTPYLPDLLLFEWTETEVFTLPDEPLPACSQVYKADHQVPVLNPAFRLIMLNHNVFLHTENPWLSEEGNFPVLFFRHPHSLETKMAALSLLDAFILERLNEIPLTIKQLINETAALTGSPVLELAPVIINFILFLHSEGMVAGFSENLSV